MCLAKDEWAVTDIAAPGASIKGRTVGFVIGDGRDIRPAVLWWATHQAGLLGPLINAGLQAPGDLPADRQTPVVGPQGVDIGREAPRHAKAGLAERAEVDLAAVGGLLLDPQSHHLDDGQGDRPPDGEGRGTVIEKGVKRGLFATEQHGAERPRGERVRFQFVLNGDNSIGSHRYFDTIASIH